MLKWNHRMESAVIYLCILSFEEKKPTYTEWIRNMGRLMEDIPCFGWHECCQQISTAWVDSWRFSCCVGFFSLIWWNSLLFLSWRLGVKESKPCRAVGKGQSCVSTRANLSVCFSYLWHVHTEKTLLMKGKQIQSHCFFWVFFLGSPTLMNENLSGEILIGFYPLHTKVMGAFRQSDLI